MSNIVNLTPHDINFYHEDAHVKGVLKEGHVPYLILSTSGQVCRCAVTSAPAGDIGGIPVSRTAYGELENLPAPQADTYYVVSAIAGAQAARDGRTDVLTIAGAIRDTQGRIVGCTGLSYPA